MGSTKINLQYTNRKNLIKDYCRLCDSKNNLDNHRIEKRGPYTKENTICLCNRCHKLTHKIKRLNEFMKFLKLVESING